MSRLQKTTFQDDISFRYDLFGGELLTRIVREIAKTRKLLPNITNDEQSKAWIWRGLGSEQDPWYWVKVTATDIITFSGFFTGESNWSKFRREVRGALLEALSGIETDSITNLTATYGWIIPRKDVEKKLSELLRFCHLFVPENLRQVETFHTLLFDSNTKQRVMFEGSQIGEEDEFRLTLSVQNSLIEKVSLANVLDEHFISTDTAYQKTNSAIESLLVE